MTISTVRTISELTFGSAALSARELVLGLVGATCSTPGSLPCCLAPLVQGCSALQPTAGVISSGKSSWNIFHGLGEVDHVDWFLNTHGRSTGHHLRAHFHHSPDWYSRLFGS